MSCSNLTSGITKGCNDQVGGITGIHYNNEGFRDDLVFEKDANDVIVRVYAESIPASNARWWFIDADNAMGNLTETYNINQNGNVLGFNQSLKFFIPTTATPSTYQPTNTLQNWVKVQAAQNQLLIAVETEESHPFLSYSPMALLMGKERRGYTNSGSKETGALYSDNNGYTIEWMADSKEPMEPIAYMALHTATGLNARLFNDGTTFTDNNVWNLNEVANYEGANVRQLGSTGFWPEYYVMPGELLTVHVKVRMDWSANCFTGSTFTPTMEIDVANDPSGTLTNQPLNYITTSYPLPTAPGVDIVEVKGTFENTTNDVVSVFPCRITSNQDPNVSMNTAPYVPRMDFLTITRTRAL